MRVLLAVVVAAGLAWSGWWWWNAAARERAAEAWLAERRAAGWVAEAGDIRLSGFPNRLDMIVTDLALADPGALWSWSAPEFQVLSLTWQPHHVIAAWPGTQTLASPLETVRLQSARMRGSLVFVPAPGFALDRSAIEIDEMTLTGDAGWSARLARALLATRRAEGEGAPPFAHEVSFNAEGLVLPVGWTGGFDPATVLPEAMDAAALDALLVFDRPWDQQAIEEDPPALEEVRIRDLRLSWGRLDLRGRGDLVADAAGYAEGRLEIRARNWREMLEIAAEAGMIGRAMAGAVETGLGLLARMSADGSSIDVTLAFAGGRARLGPVTVGAAPRLTRR